MQQKRVYKRFKNNLNIKFEILSSSSLEEAEAAWNGETQLRDVSQGGMLFTNDISIPISSFLQIEIIIPEKEFPINLTGKVVRVEEIIPNKEYEIGFVFRNIFEKDKNLLLQHIHEIEN